MAANSMSVPANASGSEASPLKKFSNPRRALSIVARGGDGLGGGGGGDGAGTEGGREGGDSGGGG